MNLSEKGANFNNHPELSNTNYKFLLSNEFRSKQLVFTFIRCTRLVSVGVYYLLISRNNKVLCIKHIMNIESTSV